MDLLQHSKAGRVSHALLCFFCPYTAIIQERRPLPGPWYILMLLYIVVFLVAALGSFVQSFSGIGAAVLLMLVLPYFYSIVEAPAICHAICMVLTGVLAWRTRKYAKLRLIAIPAIVYSVICTVLIHLVGSMDLRILTMAFGFFMMALSLYFFVFSKHVRVSDSIPTAVACSAIAGTCGGLFGVGGPCLALYMIAVADDEKTYLACLQAVFFLTNFIPTVDRVIRGVFTWEMVPVAIVGSIAALIGQFLGVKIGDKLDPDRTKRIIYICLAVSGLITALQQIFA